MICLSQNQALRLFDYFLFLIWGAIVLAVLSSVFGQLALYSLTLICAVASVACVVNGSLNLVLAMQMKKALKANNLWPKLSLKKRLDFHELNKRKYP